MAAAVSAPVRAGQGWQPHPGKQTMFHRCTAFEALFGGAAGPGKSTCGAMEALRQVHKSRYRGLLMRRTYPLLVKPGGLLDITRQWYPELGGRYNEQKHVWTFPSDAQIMLGTMQREQDRFEWRSSQFHYILFDELTEFAEVQYLYLFSRCRGAVDDGCICYMRSGSNPGGAGHTWVKRRFIETDIRMKIRYFARIGERDTEVSADHPDARSRMFIPALMNDNPSLDRSEYIRNLAQLDPIERRRLELGDWDADSTDLVYDRWSAAENVTTEAEFTPDWPVILGMDDGYAHGDGPGSAGYHPRVALLAQVTPLGGLNIFWERYATGELPEHTLAAVLEAGYPRPTEARVDSSAAELRRRIRDLDIGTLPATHPVLDGIRNVRRMICNADGIRLLRVHPRCINLIREMSSYRIDTASQVRDGELRPFKMDDHGPDAVRYLAYPLRYS